MILFLVINKVNNILRLNIIFKINDTRIKHLIIIITNSPKTINTTPTISIKNSKQSLLKSKYLSFIHNWSFSIMFTINIEM